MKRLRIIVLLLALPALTTFADEHEDTSLHQQEVEQYNGNLAQRQAENGNSALPPILVTTVEANGATAEPEPGNISAPVVNLGKIINEEDTANTQKIACNTTDNSCLFFAAKKYKCNLTDTNCFLNHNIILDGQCAPRDDKCETNIKKSQPGKPQHQLTDEGRITDAINEVPNKASEYKTAQVLGNNREQQVIDEKRRADRIKAALNIIALDNSRSSVITRVTYEPTDTEGTQRTSNSRGNVNGGLESDDTESDNIQKQPPVVLIKAGQQIYATADIALSSKYQGPVSVRLHTSISALEGAIGIGQMVILEDLLRLELNTLVLRNGIEIPISAIVLDKETTYAAIASHVDYHTIYRYGWWGFGTFMKTVGAVAKIKATSVNVTTNSDGTSSTTTTVNPKTTSDLYGLALAELGVEIGGQFANRLNKKPTITVRRNESMGVWFEKTVYANQLDFKQSQDQER